MKVWWVTVSNVPYPSPFMFKVLHVIPSVSLIRGGPTQVVLNMVRSLREAGIEAEITATNDDGPSVLDVPLGEPVNYEGVPVWFFPRYEAPTNHVSLGGDRSFLFSLPWTKWLWHNLRHYDILDHHYLFSYGSTCAAQIAQRQNIPYTVRTMGQLSPWALGQSQRKKQLYAWLLERSNLNHAAAIHCTSSGEAEDVRNFGVTRPTVILPLGVEPPPPLPDAQDQLRHRYSIPPDTPIILFLSRLHYKKRPELLLETLKTLQPDYNFHLLLAGTATEEGYLEKLQHLTHQLGLQQQVTFTGFVSGDDKALVLQGSDFFVLPSYAENFAIAVAEAMAASLPVIVTPNIQIAPDIAATEAGIVVQGEQGELAAAIAQLLSSPQQRHKMGENGKKLVRSCYSWQAIVQQLIPIYQNIIAPPKLSL
ncbi:glycosyltransferase [Spirulina sp. CS-785/01]|uniref:glycosyltransferase n=1 Tax=Spirulina sp. CS-785/01 TaxID=3021716 RepID=UPI00232FA9A2|nr:glycosyltransferase [Spirulina sp. CS-785/01]MDB9312601.1 glycosyltransferase [Spirulina sp. CS-785/01]